MADMRDRPALLMIAGFGDDAGMFERLSAERVARGVDLRPFDLPGFGAPALDTPASLAALADQVHAEACASGAQIILAHSVASIIASLAAQRRDSPLRKILSPEGNLTAEDAYFSGTAADYPDAASFRDTFLVRLEEMESDDPVIARYRQAVLRADPESLWRLGCDARRFSDSHVPGQVLSSAAETTYLYNAENCPPSSMQWLEANEMKRIALPGASHWARVDRPDLLSEAILAALD
jgi:pimeloyl-ACP methyl ester carboxylesterase